jgi:hypothetical protein
VSLSEEEFLARLREVTRRYLDSVDAWETQYRKFYRVRDPGPDCVGPDLEPLHQDYLKAKKELQACVPRARQLCMRYGVKERWHAMLHLSLGAQPPQEGATTAIGRAERNFISESLAALEAASAAPAKQAAPAPESKGLCRRIRDYFF